MTVPKPLVVAIATGLALVGIGAGATGATSPKQMTNPTSMKTKAPRANGPSQIIPKPPPSTTTSRPKPPAPT